VSSTITANIGKKYDGKGITILFHEQAAPTNIL
jgi:hypothetical protein